MRIVFPEEGDLAVAEADGSVTRCGDGKTAQIVEAFTEGAQESIGPAAFLFPGLLRPALSLFQFRVDDCYCEFIKRRTR